MNVRGLRLRKVIPKLRSFCMRAFLVFATVFSIGCAVTRMSNTSPGTPPTGNLSASNSALDFGNVQVGSTKTMPLSLTNIGGQNATVEVSQVTVTGPGFNASGANPPLTLAAGQSVTLNINFTPSSPGLGSGSVSIVSTAADPTIKVTLSGTGTSPGQLGLTPTSMNFGIVQVGSKQTLPLTLSNSVAQATAIQISQLNVSGSAFSESGTSLPITLTGGQSVTLSIGFTPSSSGVASGSISIVSNATNPNVSVTLSGMGAGPGQLGVSPGTMNFGIVTVGSSQNQNGTLSAGSSSITVSSASTNGTGFSISGISFPVTIPAGQTVPFTIIFAPQTSGNVSGTVSFLSNATNSPTNEPLTGTGAQANPHSVGLSWNPDTSTVQGYYVYRGVQTGGPYTKISSLQPGTSYTDANVSSGQTYYYVVTALGTNSIESLFSAEAVAVVP